MKAVLVNIFGGIVVVGLIARRRYHRRGGRSGRERSGGGASGKSSNAELGAKKLADSGLNIIAAKSRRMRLSRLLRSGGK